MEYYGEANGHLVGIALKEIVRRAIDLVRARRFNFETGAKQGVDGGADVFTDADQAAQRLYVKLLQEQFPGIGIVAEEEHLNIASSLEFENIWFTIDPIDGTRAFIRGQSSGVGTMIALVDSGEVAAAYVGDVMTGEVYGFRPGSDRVHRISDFSVATTLPMSSAEGWDSQYISLREDPRDHSEGARALVDSFKGITVDSGSIGIHLARLWKGEVGAVLLPPSHETPWDITPVIGITQRLGYNFWTIDPETGDLSKYSPVPVRETLYRDVEALIA